MVHEEVRVCGDSIKVGLRVLNSCSEPLQGGELRRVLEWEPALLAGAGT